MSNKTIATLAIIGGAFGYLINNNNISWNKTTQKT